MGTSCKYLLVLSLLVVVLSLLVVVLSLLVVLLWVVGYDAFLSGNTCTYIAFGILTWVLVREVAICSLFLYLNT